MALTLKLDLHIVKIYHHTKNGVSTSTASKDVAHTHRHFENITYPRTWKVAWNYSHSFERLNRCFAGITHIFVVFFFSKLKCGGKCNPTF